MSSRNAGRLSEPLRLTKEDFDLEFPEPDVPLLEGPGEPCTWIQFMGETAFQTNHWLKHFGNEPPPPAWEEKFVLE